MLDLKTFRLPGSLEMLRAVFIANTIPQEIASPLQTLATGVAARAEQAPLAVYLCSADGDSDLRNFLAFALAKAVTEIVPDLLLIDCDFLEVGLSGVVPNRDGLGFLDLLLYGSSLEAVTQETQGNVRVIGAGSFPVTRRSPFVMEAFQSSRRYIDRRARISIFTGPVLDDDRNVHPIAGETELALVVRTGERAQEGIPDPIEDRLATFLRRELWSVRVVEPVELLEIVEPEAVPDIPGAVEPEPVDTAEVMHTPLPPAEPAIEPVPEWSEEATSPVTPRTGSSSLFRVLAAVIAIALGVFVIWWLNVTKTFREEPPEQKPPRQAQQLESTKTPPGQAQESETGAQTPTVVPRESLEVAAAPQGERADSTEVSRAAESRAEVEPKRDEPTTTEPPPKRDEPKATEPPPKQDEPKAAEPQPKQVTSTAPGSEHITVSDDIGEYAGSYVVHVSSFRRLENAITDAEYFAGRGYEIVIAPADLGENGRWYRVYVGPVTTAEQAKALKIRLDENPRVKFTRITKVPN